MQALTTLAHCLHHPSPEITLFTTAHRTLIRNLTQFQYVDTYRLDRGAAVREEAHVVVALMMRRDDVRKEDTPSSSLGASASGRRSSFTPVTAIHAPPRPTPASPGPLFPTHFSQVFPHWNPSHPHHLLHTPTRHRRDLVQESIHDRYGPSPPSLAFTH